MLPREILESMRLTYGMFIMLSAFEFMRWAAPTFGPEDKLLVDLKRFPIMAESRPAPPFALFARFVTGSMGYSSERFSEPISSSFCFICSYASLILFTFKAAPAFVFLVLLPAAWLKAEAPNILELGLLYGDVASGMSLRTRLPDRMSAFGRA